MIALLFALPQVVQMWDSEKASLAEELKRDVPVVTPSSKTVPVGFMGDPPLGLVTNYMHLGAAKDRFETTDQYNARMDTVRKQPLIGSLTPNDYLAFKPTADPTRSYDADTQTVTMSMKQAASLWKQNGFEHDTIELFTLGVYPTEKGTIDARTPLNVTFKETRLQAVRVVLGTPLAMPINMELEPISENNEYDELTAQGFQMKFPMKLDDAKVDLDNLQFLFVGRLVSDNALREKDYSQGGSVGDPFDLQYFNMQLFMITEVIDIYSPKTGQIYYQYTIKLPKGS